MLDFIKELYISLAYTVAYHALCHVTCTVATCCFFTSVEVKVPDWSTSRI